MTTHASLSHAERSPIRGLHDFSDALRFVVPLGRALFAAIFIAAAFGHFSHQTVAYAARQGVPLADIAVPLSGLLAMAGGLSVLLGYHAKIGAWLLVLFLLPVTFMMHRFWAVDDPMMVAIQQAMFMKNLSMLGGALLVAFFGAGPFSIDARQGRDVR